MASIDQILFSIAHLIEPASGGAFRIFLTSGAHIPLEVLSAMPTSRPFSSLVEAGKTPESEFTPADELSDSELPVHMEKDGFLSV
jgi:hypothetical protein